ncbi:Cyclin-U4-3 [Diplonema papillatum]|nr:Cyclin-U4-3 [Diplonema papillatum]
MSACPLLEEVVDSNSFHTLLPVIARILEKNLVVSCDNAPTAFSGKVDRNTPPVDRFLYRFVKYGCCSKEVFVFMMIYLSRHAAKTGLDLAVTNVHRLIITAFLAAVKIRDDTPYCNVYYSKLGGVSIQELNQLERIFLVGIDFDLMVAPKDYEAMIESLTTASTSCDVFTVASPPLKDATHRSPVRATHKYDYTASPTCTLKSSDSELHARGSALRAVRARTAAK